MKTLIIALLFSGLVLGQSLFSPPVELYEDAAGYDIKIDMPGVPLEEIDIRVEQNILKVSGRRDLVIIPGKSLLWSEVTYGGLQRLLPLKATVDPNEILVNSRDGVLLLRLHKIEKN